MNENCFVKQTSINDCGVACLLMILKSYDIDETLNSLKQKMKIKENGVSAYEIVKTAKKYNLVCTGYKSININNLTLPAIVPGSCCVSGRRLDIFRPRLSCRLLRHNRYRIMFVVGLS